MRTRKKFTYCSFLSYIPPFLFSFASSRSQLIVPHHKRFLLLRVYVLQSIRCLLPSLHLLLAPPLVPRPPRTNLTLFFSRCDSTLMVPVDHTRPSSVARRCELPSFCTEIFHEDVKHTLLPAQIWLYTCQPRIIHYVTNTSLLSHCSLNTWSRLA